VISDGNESDLAVDVATTSREGSRPAPVTPLLKPPSYNQLPWEPIAKHKVEAAVFRASPDKAPRRDGLPARVWRELWPVLSGEITTLFTKLLETGKVPQE